MIDYVDPSIPIFSSLCSGATQIRFAHTDIQTPDFSDYRREQVKRPNARNDSADDRAAFTYLLVGGKYLAFRHVTYYQLIV